MSWPGGAGVGRKAKGRDEAIAASEMEALDTRRREPAVTDTRDIVGTHSDFWEAHSSVDPGAWHRFRY